MSDDLLQLLNDYPLKEHQRERDLQEDLASYLNQRIFHESWRFGRGVKPAVRVIGTRSTPDIVCSSPESPAAIEVKYIRSSRNGRPKGSGSVFWSGIGQAFANRFTYGTSILFVQTDVGYTEQYGEGGPRGSVIVKRAQIVEVARRDWGIYIVWRDRSGRVPQG